MSQVNADVVLGGRYRLLERIATGGMGTVWKAADTVLGRRVAVKVLSEALADDAAFVDRFRREARASAGLAHPNVASVFDYGEDGSAGRPGHVAFLVMELVEGETLASALHRRGRLPPEEAARIAAEVAAALEAAHRSGLVHRDVKPANVMITPRGEVKVMDFGIAAAVGASSLTATGSMIGTAAYVSPERVRGERATPSSDVYSLGVVLFEMLTGRTPFEAETPVGLALAHVQERAPSVVDLAPGVPAPLAEACALALSKDPGDRPRSAAEFRSMLLRVARTPPAAPAPATAPAAGDATEVIEPDGGTAVLPAVGGPPPPTRRRRRVRPWIVTGAVAALLLAAFAWILLVAPPTATTRPPSSPSGPQPSVSATSPAGVPVPDVQGFSLDQARNALVAAGLTPGPVQEVSGPKDVVVGTLPPAGTTVGSTTPVTLLVGGKGHGDNGKHDGKGNGG